MLSSALYEMLWPQPTPDLKFSTQLPTRTYQTCQTLLLHLPEVSTAPARTFHELTFINIDNNMVYIALCSPC